MTLVFPWQLFLFHMNVAMFSLGVTSIPKRETSYWRYAHQSSLQCKPQTRQPSKLGTIALSYPPRVRVRATVKLLAAFFHDESSITKGGVQKCNSAQHYYVFKSKIQLCYSYLDSQLPLFSFLILFFTLLILSAMPSLFSTFIKF